MMARSRPEMTPEQRERKRETDRLWRANRTEEQKQAHRESCRLWRAKRTPEQIELQLARTRAYKKNNPGFRKKYREQENKYRRERYATDKEFRERLIASKLDWQRRNPDKYLASQRKYDLKRRSMLKGLGFPCGVEARQRELMKIDIYALARKSLPQGLPAFIRDDVVTDIVLANLEGTLALDEVPTKAKEFLTAHYRMFDQWKKVSLDAPVPGTDGKVTYLDRLAAEDINELV